MKILNVATFDSPVAMLNPLVQAFNTNRRFNVLVYFCISPYTVPLILTTLVTYFELRSDDRGSSGADGIGGYIL